MERQSRLMFVLATVLLALVALIVLIEPPEEDDGEQSGDESWEAAMEGVEAHQVQALTVERGAELRTFRRDAEGWRITAPIQAPASDPAVEALVASFVAVELGESLEGSAAEYGLEPPQATVELELDDGSSHVLEVGRDAPVGWHSYVRVDGEQQIRPSRTRLSANLDTSLDDFRQKALWRFGATAVDRARLVGPEALVELERRADDWWVRASLASGDGSPPLADAPWVRADEAVVDAALDNLAALRAEAFLDQPLDGEQPWTVTVEAAGARQQLQARLEGGRWLASAPLQESAVVLPADWLSEWIVPVPEWWALDIASVDEGEGATLTLRLGQQEQSGSWTEDEAWTPEQANSLVHALRAAQVDRSPVQAEGEPWGELRLRRPSGEERVLRFHQELADGGRVIVDEAGGAAFTISGLELGRIETVLDQSVPDQTALDQTVPDQTVPDQTVLDQTVLDQTVPDQTPAGD